MKRISEASLRFVPQKFLKLLGKESIRDVELGNQVKKEMSIFFSDIRDFSAISEKMTPQESFNFINAYLGRMEPVIHRNSGFIDKYMGDSIIALFPERADDALDCAIEAHAEVEDFNRYLAKAGYEPIKIGVGLNTGMMMLGTIGGKDRIEGTVISDAVNMAARIEKMNKRVRRLGTHQRAGSFSAVQSEQLPLPPSRSDRRQREEKQGGSL